MAGTTSVLALFVGLNIGKTDILHINNLSIAIPDFYIRHLWNICGKYTLLKEWFIIQFLVKNLANIFNILSEFINLYIILHM